MPVFKLKLQNDTPYAGIDQALDVPDEAGAIAEAAKAAADVLKDELAKGLSPVQVAVTVFEAASRVVGVVMVRGSFQREVSN